MLDSECLPLDSALKDSKGGVQSVVDESLDTSIVTDKKFTSFRRLDMSPSSGGTRKMCVYNKINTLNPVSEETSPPPLENTNNN